MRQTRPGFLWSAPKFGILLLPQKTGLTLFPPEAHIGRAGDPLNVPGESGWSGNLPPNS